MTGMTNTTAIVWFRRDLRLADNPAFFEALKLFETVVPVYIWSPEEDSRWAPGAASRVWLYHSLEALANAMAEKQSRLILRRGEALPALQTLIKDTGATAVFWNRLYEPSVNEQDAGVEKALRSDGVECEIFPGNLLLEPWDSRKKDDTAYRVFTPFANALKEKLDDIKADPAPGVMSAVPPEIYSDDLESFDLLPKIERAGGIQEAWTFGEAGGQAALKDFIQNGLGGYSKTRNLPAMEDGVSRLSPYLHFGEISIRHVWADVSKARAKLSGAEQKSADVYLKELLWREFSHHLLFHFPTMPDKPLREEFSRYRWATSGTQLKAWQRGQTGYPIVDAGMRQLWETGWMHNRVRMIVGSFLIKDLGIEWQTGEEWFWDSLVDADLAQNAMNWQWVAGSGADASPFFRIFNPVTQGKKFDPEGEYVRRYVPELKDMPAKWIHAPFDAPGEVLEGADVKLGDNYPKPIVDHDEARKQALANYQKIR